MQAEEEGARGKKHEEQQKDEQGRERKNSNQMTN